jgi:hypothetical protein
MQITSARTGIYMRKRFEYILIAFQIQNSTIAITKIITSSHKIDEMEKPKVSKERTLSSVALVNNDTSLK